MQKILLIQCEMHSWRAARAWSYNLHLGWEEGFRANQIDYLTITTPWLENAQRIIGKRKFDQVWINDLVLSSARDGGDITEAQLAWLETLAPVRVGLLTETIYDYTAEEYVELPDMQRTQAQVEKCLKHLTHVVAFDETDVEKVKEHSGLPCFWGPSPVSNRWIHETAPTPASDYAFFSGSVYRGRQDWLEHPVLQKYLKQLASPDEGTRYPKVFDRLHNHRMRAKIKHPLAAPFYPLYLKTVRDIRQRSYVRWLKGLQSGIAVVNLPHFVKSYTPRVIESMAAGRPVLTWEIPERPLNKALFEHNKEILLFSTPDELSEHIQRLQVEPSTVQKMTEQARRRMRAFHTLEKRVAQITDWIESGNICDYQ